MFLVVLQKIPIEIGFNFGISNGMQICSNEFDNTFLLLKQRSAQTYLHTYLQRFINSQCTKGQRFTKVTFQPNQWLRIQNKKKSESEYF